MKKFSIITSLIAVAALSACSHSEPEVNRMIENNGQYWQRINVSSALYLRGPKAQQALNVDIAKCVNEINTLHRVGAIRNGFPAENLPDGSIPDKFTPEGQMAIWNTPEHDGNRLYEHLDYHDFDSCMTYQGWERIKYIPYNVAENAKDVYYETMLGEKRRTYNMQK